MKTVLEKIAADGWREDPLGQPFWKWFVRGEENLYFYELTGEAWTAKRFIDVLRSLPCWAQEKGHVLQMLYFVDPATIKHKPKAIRGKLREGSGNFQNNLFRNLREPL